MGSRGMVSSFESERRLTAVGLVFFLALIQSGQKNDYVIFRILSILDHSDGYI